MTRTSVTILAAMAMIWGLAALAFAGLQNAALAVPPIISAMLALFAWKGLPRSVVSHASAQRVRRTVRLWTLIEVVAIVAAVFGLQRLGAPDFIPAAICAIVGLHFFPLAPAMRQPLYLATGVAMVVMAGIAAFIVPSDIRVPVASASAAVVLWATAIILIVIERDSRASAIASTSRKRF